MYADMEYINKYSKQDQFSDQKSNTDNSSFKSQNAPIDKITQHLPDQTKTQKVIKQLNKIPINFKNLQDNQEFSENLYEGGRIQHKSRNQNIDQDLKNYSHPQQEYSDFETIINCPYCGTNSTSQTDFIPMVLKQLGKRYLFHKNCYSNLSKQDILYFQNISIFRDTVVKPYETSISNFSLNQHLNFYKYCYGQLTIYQNLNNLIYLQIQKKIPIKNYILNWRLSDQSLVLFHPNIICLPLMEFKVQLTIEIHGVSMVYEFIVNLNQYQKKYKQKKFIAYATSIDNVILEGEIIQNSDKKFFLDKMNYKYYQNNTTIPMVKLNNIKFKIPPFFQKKLYLIAQNYYSNQYFNYNQHKQNPQLYNNNLTIHDTKVNNTIINSLSETIDEFVDIYQVIVSKQVEQYVKTNAGSRHVQKFLKKCSQQNLQYFIQAVYPILPKLVACPYGNYTFQQLINVCTPQKKRKLISKLGQDISQLAKLKQGTHALQTLISSITFQNQICLIKESIKHDILILSKDNNGTHFIKKILIYFGNSSYKYIQFIHLNIIDNFIDYCTDANGVLVVKTLMNQIKDIDLMRNQLIQKIQKNLETIIQDPYGNYVVQEAYILFKEAKLKSITVKIIEKFVPYSVNKYASNVIINCLQQYCGKQFYKSVEAMLIKIRIYQDMPKNVSGQHILKLLYQKSQNTIFIEDIKSIIPKEKMEKLGWEVNSPKNDKKEVQTVKVENQKDFNSTVADYRDRNGNFQKNKLKGCETMTNSMMQEKPDQYRKKLLKKVKTKP